MKKRTLALAAIAASLSLLAGTASAYDGDWKRARIYYRSVCTACHEAQAGGSIAPSKMTKAEWAAYIRPTSTPRAKIPSSNTSASLTVPASRRKTRPLKSLPMFLTKNCSKT